MGTFSIGVPSLAEREYLDPGNATSIADLSERGVAFSEMMGCKKFAYILLHPPHQQSVNDDYVISNYPAEWMNRYIERNYQYYDPVAKIFNFARLPFFWGQRGFLKRFTKAERIVLHEAEEFSLSKGYAIPTAGPDGDTGGISFSFERQSNPADLVGEKKDQLQLFAARFHAAAIRILCGECEKPAAVLTQREKEVLMWSAEGYSSEAAASRMGVTTATVNYHIGNCCRKLGGRNKIQAVALAIRRNLI